MRKLSLGQRRVAAEIVGNIAVAWFSAGVISPFFIRPRRLLDFLSLVSLGLMMTVLFSSASLRLVKGVKS